VPALSPIETVVVLAALLAIALTGLYTGITWTPPTSTSPRVRRTMFQLIPADFRGPIFELGSGWGMLAVALARRYPGCRVHAYELSPIPYVVSRLWCRMAGVGNLEIRRANFLQADLRDARLVVCYLSGGLMERLRVKFERELGDGALVLSNTFAIADWRPVAEVRAGDFFRSKVYLYRMERRRR
jgi:hypothetical protein